MTVLHVLVVCNLGNFVDVHGYSPKVNPKKKMRFQQKFKPTTTAST